MCSQFVSANQEKTHAAPGGCRTCGAAGGRPNSLRWHYPDQVRGSAGGARTLSAVRSPVGCEVVSPTLAPTGVAGPAGHPPGLRRATGRRRLGTLPIMRVDARGCTFDVTRRRSDGRRPVLLLHGFPQTAASGTTVVPALHAAGLRTYAPDQRGYSPGARPDEVAAYRLPELVADVVAVLDALGLDAAHVVGHDWGAIVAWALAAWHPDRVRTLTAVSVPHPAAMAHALATDAEQKERSAYIRLFRRPGKAEKVLLADDAAAAAADAARRGEPDAGRGGGRVRRPMLSAPGALTAALNWYRAMRCGDRRVGPVGVPTTYVWSDGDVAIGRTAAEACARVRHRRLPLRGAARRDALDPGAGARPAGRGDPGPSRRNGLSRAGHRGRASRRRTPAGRAAAVDRRAAARAGRTPRRDDAGARRRCVRWASSAAARRRWCSPCVTRSARGGTIVVPTHTPENSDPAAVAQPAGAGGLVAGDPLGDAGLRPGGHSEPVHGGSPRRSAAGPVDLRSSHPQVSFAALGPAAEQVWPGTPWPTCSARAPHWLGSTTWTPTCCCSAWTIGAAPRCTWPRIPAAPPRPGERIGCRRASADGGRELGVVAGRGDSTRQRLRRVGRGPGGHRRAVRTGRSAPDGQVDAPAGGGRLRGRLAGPQPRTAEDS